MGWILLDVFLWQSEVDGEDFITILMSSQQEILRFYISMDEFISMHML